MVSLIAGKNTGEKRDSEETAEEKRLRKAQIKQGKRVSARSLVLLYVSPAPSFVPSRSSPVSSLACRTEPTDVRRSWRFGMFAFGFSKTLYPDMRLVGG